MVSAKSLILAIVPFHAILTSCLEDSKFKYDGVVLRPIPLPAYEAASGLQRRAGSKPFTEMDPSTKAKLIYGNAGYQNHTVLAELDLTAPNGLPIVLMEKFGELAPKVDCNANDSKMSLTFKDKNAYDYALGKWSYINENKDDQFLLIANHAGCGPNEQRQPYYISNVHDDAGRLTVNLDAREAKWSDIAGTYTLRWGPAKPAQHQRLRSRDLGSLVDNVGGAIHAGANALHDIAQDAGDAVQNAGANAAQAVSDTAQDIGNTVQDIGGGIVDTVQGDFDYSPSVSLPFSVGTPNQTTALFSDQNGQLKVDCLNCFVQGSLQLTGHITVNAFKTENITLTIAPSNVVAVLQLGATITASTTPTPFSAEKDLFSVAIPNAGISIPNVFSVGPTIAYTVGFETTISGTGVVEFGAQATIPNTASAIVNLMDSAASRTMDWDKATLDGRFDVKNLSASITAAVYSKPNLELGLKFFDTVELGATLGFNVPRVSSTLSAKYADDGVCKDDGNKSKTGVESTSKVELSLEADVNAAVGTIGGGVFGVPAWSKKLWSKVFDLPRKCWPLDIPGLIPGGSNTASSVPSSTSPMSTVSSASLFSSSKATKVTTTAGSSQSITRLTSITSRANTSSIKRSSGTTTTSATKTMKTTLQTSIKKSSVTSPSDTGVPQTSSKKPGNSSHATNSASRTSIVAATTSSRKTDTGAPQTSTKKSSTTSRATISTTKANNKATSLASPVSRVS